MRIERLDRAILIPFTLYNITSHTDLLMFFLLFFVTHQSLIKTKIVFERSLLLHYASVQKKNTQNDMKIEHENENEREWAKERAATTTSSTNMRLIAMERHQLHPKTTEYYATIEIRIVVFKCHYYFGMCVCICCDCRQQNMKCWFDFMTAWMNVDAILYGFTMSIIGTLNRMHAEYVSFIHSFQLSTAVSSKTKGPIKCSTKLSNQHWLSRLVLDLWTCPLGWRPYALACIAITHSYW